MSKNITFNFADFQLAWEGMNEFLANNQTEITNNGYGGTYGTEMVLYGAIINVELAKMDANFDFGKELGYTNKKWSKLVNNYINFDYLELVKSEVLAREKKKATSYNHVFHFDNSHGSGKDCLISLQFQKRLDEDYPCVIFTTRASECTKRLIFDLLLIQRMTEYVYGTKQIINAKLFIPFMYINVESYLIYCHHKGGPDKILTKDDELEDYTLFQKRIFDRWEKFTTVDISEIKYRVHKRAAMQIQGKSGAKHFLAKDLKLRIYPPSISQNNLNKLNEGIL